MLHRSQDLSNWRDEESIGIDFDQVVTEDALRRHFGYFIPMGKEPLDKKGNPSKKANISEGSAADGADRPTKKTAKTKNKSSKGGSVPKGANPGGESEGPSKKKKKAQKKTPPPLSSPVRDGAKSANVVAEEVHPEVEPTTQDKTHSEGLGNLVSRSPSGAAPSATFAATEEVVPEPRDSCG